MGKRKGRCMKSWNRRVVERSGDTRLLRFPRVHECSVVEGVTQSELRTPGCLALSCSSFSEERRV